MYPIRSGEPFRQVRMLRQACQEDGLLGQSVLINSELGIRNAELFLFREFDFQNCRGRVSRPVLTAHI